MVLTCADVFQLRLDASNRRNRLRIAIVATLGKSRPARGGLNVNNHIK